MPRKKKYDSKVPVENSRTSSRQPKEDESEPMTKDTVSTEKRMTCERRRYFRQLVAFRAKKLRGQAMLRDIRRLVVNIDKIAFTKLFGVSKTTIANALKQIRIFLRRLKCGISKFVPERALATGIRSKESSNTAASLSTLPIYCRNYRVGRQRKQNTKPTQFIESENPGPATSRSQPTQLQKSVRLVKFTPIEEPTLPIQPALIEGNEYNMADVTKSNEDILEENTALPSEASKNVSKPTITKRRRIIQRRRAILESPTNIHISEDTGPATRFIKVTQLNEAVGGPISLPTDEITGCRGPAVRTAIGHDLRIQAAELELPILGNKQEIVNMISKNSVVIIFGETGSGKSTQVPRFLYEAGYAQDRIIGVVQPRRIAAIAMSQRVADEMSLTSDEVSYIVRYKDNTTNKTRMKFMTSSVLINQILRDQLLSSYSLIVVDEAQERSSITDILIGLLSITIQMRAATNNPLKLIIISAVQGCADLLNNRQLFAEAPAVLTIKRHLYHINIRYIRVMKPNYIQAAFDAARIILRDKPEGGILIFVSSFLEVKRLVQKLRNQFSMVRAKKTPVRRNTTAQQLTQLPDVTLCAHTVPSVIEDEDYNTIWRASRPNADWDAASSDDDDDMLVPCKSSQLRVLPLHSMLSEKKVQRVFQPLPEGVRLCVVATSIAETSVSIPHIKYVIDTGKTTLKRYDNMTGVTKFAVTWTSKICAQERSNHAGRTGPGECIRLYSTAVFQKEFPDALELDIKLKPVDKTYLLLQSLGIKDIANFPFPTPPSTEQIAEAEQTLHVIGALKKGALTKLGTHISYLPMHPRFGKMIVLSNEYGFLNYVTLLVAVLSVEDIFVGDRNKFANILATKGEPLSDSLLDMLAIIEAGQNDKLNLRVGAVQEVRCLQKQLILCVQRNVKERLPFIPDMEMPNAAQCAILRQIILSGIGDKVARIVQVHELDDINDRQKYKGTYNVEGVMEPVHISSSSCLKKELPEFLAFHELYELHGKWFIGNATAIEPQWLPIIVPYFCRIITPEGGGPIPVWSTSFKTT